MSSPEERIRVLQDSLRDEPHDPLTYYLLGLEYAKLGRHLDAIDAFERTVRVYPEYAAAYRELAKSLRDAGRRKEAEETFGKGIEVAQRTHDGQAMKEMLVLLKRLKGTRP